MRIGLNELLIHAQNHLSFNYTSSAITNTVENLRRRLVVQKKTSILFKKLGAATQLKQVGVGDMKSHNIKFQSPTFSFKENIATVYIFVKKSFF